MSRITEGIFQHRIMSLCVLMTGVYMIGGSESVAADIYEEIWFGTAQYDYATDMKVAIRHPEVASEDENIHFVVELASGIPYQSTVITIDILNSNNESVHQSVLELDLHRGNNEISFEWNPSSISFGRYTLRLTINYSDYLPVSQTMLPFRKVSTLEWKQEIENAKNILETVEAPLQAFPDTGYGTTLKTQYRISKSAVTDAGEAMEKQQWHKVDHLVNYLTKTCKSIHAGLVFQNKEEAGMEEITAPSLKKLEIRDGAFFSDGNPVFLFGTELDADESSLSQLDELRQYGLNFAVKTVPVNQEPEQMRKTLEDFTEDVASEPLAVAVQVNQEIISGTIMDQWPNLLEPGFVNLAHEGFRELFAERLNTIASALSKKPGVVGLSLAQSPQFRFDGEDVRQQFVAYIQDRYPDRIELNRLWRSHLADYDEITVWGEHPDHSYQNRRAFQYEWQNFQRGLITSLLSTLDQELCQAAPDLPLMLTLPNSAFLPAETRTGVNREEAAWLMDMNGCNVVSGPCEALYSMNYPTPQAYYTLMHSYTPDKPIVTMKGDIALNDQVPVEMYYALVQSAIWEAVMCGMNAMALPPESAVYEYPESLEAYVTTANDVNRLADIVVAFQQAPAEIGILFSEASKIMDDGVPHLESAKYAFEGASFAGYSLRFVTESQIAHGALEPINVLILPDTLAVSDETFTQISAFVEEGGAVARVGKPIPYNERGMSRSDVIRSTGNTVLVRGLNLPTEYLHAMDAAQEGGALPEISRPINVSGYPLEGVRSRYITYNDDKYLYIINLRKDPVNCYLTGYSFSGIDLIRGKKVDFPRVLPPLEPMLIRLDKHSMEATLAKN